MNDFLRGRDVLKRALVLIDSRHGIKDVDREILDMLDAAAVSYRVVLTKADKIKASELAEVTARTEEEARKRPAAHPDILATSSEKGGHRRAARRGDRGGDAVNPTPYASPAKAGIQFRAALG